MGFPSSPCGDRARKPNLVVVLFNRDLIDELQFRDERSPLKLFPVIEIRNVADYKVPAVDRGGVTLFQQPPQIIIMIGQLVKH